MLYTMQHFISFLNCTYILFFLFFNMLQHA